MMNKRTLICLALVVGCGSDSTSPGSSEVAAPSTFRVSLSTAMDTVEARLTSAIQVSVVDTKSRPLALAAVTVRVIPDRVLVDPGFRLLAAAADTVAMLRTSPAGVVGFDVALNKYPGTFAAVVSVDGITRQDTVTFTVLPGQPVAIQVPTRDTLTTIDVPYRPLILVSDRLGNRRADQPTLTTTSGSCRVTDATVTASDVSRCIVAVRSGALRDSLILTVVPRVRVNITTGAFGGRWIATMNLDGTDIKLIRAVGSPTFDFNHPVIARDGTVAVVDVGSDFKTHIRVVDPSGNAKFIPVDLPAGAEQTWPVFAPDGQSIYFSACNHAMFEHCRVWQTKLDGSQPRILTPSANSTGQRSNSVDITPDGRTLVYSGSGTRIHTLDLQTGRDVDIGFYTSLFSIDPSGTRLASARYVGDILQPLVISNLDGTNSRTITPGQGFYETVQWLPGGQWILSTMMIANGPGSARGGPRVLVNANTGETVPLKFGVSSGELWIPRQ